MKNGHRSDTETDVIDLDFCCPVETRILPLLRAFTVAMAREVGFEEDQIEQIEMAVDEACANVIRHAYKHLGISSDLPTGESDGEREARRGCTLRLRAILGSDYLKISIIDRGIGLHHMPGGAGSMEEYQSRGGSGGLGIYIIRHFMDKVDYECPDEAGTILTMIKYRRTSVGSSR